jgi:hypothetical protein
LGDLTLIFHPSLPIFAMAYVEGDHHFGQERSHFGMATKICHQWHFTLCGKCGFYRLPEHGSRPGASFQVPVWNSLYWIIILFSAVNAVAKSFVQEHQGRQLYYYMIASPEAIILIENHLQHPADPGPCPYWAIWSSAWFLAMRCWTNPCFYLNLLLGAIGIFCLT